MTDEKVVDVAYNTRAAVTRVRIDSAFLTVAADLARVGGVNVLADNVAVMIEGVGGGDYVVGALAFVVVLLLGGGYKGSCGCSRIGIGGACADRAIGTVFGYTFKAISIMSQRTVPCVMCHDNEIAMSRFSS